jgi:hypothetical protein
MVKTPIIREPFSKIAIDIVGPLSRTKKHLQRHPANKKTEVPSVYIFLVLSDLALDDHVLTLAQPFLTALVKQSGFADALLGMDILGKSKTYVVTRSKSKQNEEIENEMVESS